MADYGLQVVGSHGVIQVDQNYFNLQFKQSGWVTTSNVANSYVEFSVSAINPLIVLKSPDAVATIIATTRSGNTYTYRIAAATATTVYWYLFDSSVPTPSNGYGLRVYNSAGQLTFDSGTRALKIYSLLSDVSVGSGTTGGKIADLPAGNWGTILTRPRVTGTPGAKPILSQMAARVTATELFVFATSFTYASGTSAVYNGQCDLLLVDLTGIA
ncbi:hypothetical protein ACIPF8_18925 [Collimonas sp. NPDC087041]|uniref:hypothetical protein n=1 Tax=Collimonas sp. NPDC087041 TaxID=3363960 RepID=UPI003803CA37